MDGRPYDPYGGKGPTLLGISWGLGIVATIVVVLRTHASGNFFSKPAAWDLVWVLVAFLLSMTSQALGTAAVLNGLGQHLEYVSVASLIRAYKYGWISQIMGLHGIFFGKAAIVAVLLQLQPSSHKKSRILLLAVLLATFVINALQTIFLCLGCRPIEKTWNISVPGDCSLLVSTSSDIGYFQASWSAVSDAFLATYAIAMFWKSTNNRRQRAGLCGLMSGGYIAAIAGTVKTIYIKRIQRTTDSTFNAYPVTLSAYVEMWLVIIVGSLPQLRVFLSLIKTRLSGKDSAPGSSIQNLRYQGPPRMDGRADSSIGWGTQSTADRLNAPLGVLPSLNNTIGTGTSAKRHDEEVGRVDIEPKPHA